MRLNYCNKSLRIAIEMSTDIGLVGTNMELFGSELESKIKEAAQERSDKPLRVRQSNDLLVNSPSKLPYRRPLDPNPNHSLPASKFYLFVEL